MKHLAIEIKKLFRVWLIIAKLSFMSRVAGSQFGFYINFLLSAFECSVVILFAHVIFADATSIVGFSHEQILIMFGTALIIDGLFWLTTRPGLDAAPESIAKGKIDTHLTKPISPAFLLCIRRVDFEDLSRVLIGLVLVIPASGAIANPAILHILLYLISLVFAVIAITAAGILLTTLSLYFGKIEVQYLFFNQLQSIGKYPHTFYSKPVQFIMLTLIPIALIASVPTIILTTPGPYLYFAHMLLWPSALFAISIKILNHALRRYTSASS